MSEEEIEPDGRYAYDLIAFLDYSPCGGKHPYRVITFQWGLSGSRWEPSWGNNFPHIKGFRTLDKAVRYYHHVASEADYGFLSRQVRESRDARREVLL